MPIYDGKVYNACGFEDTRVVVALEILHPVAPEPNLAFVSESLRCGHRRSQYREQNCSVIALSVITGEEASDIAEYAAGFGLDPERGMHAGDLLRMLDAKGIEYDIIYTLPDRPELFWRPTVREFAARYPHGAYLVGACMLEDGEIECHAVPVLDGKMYNACGFEGAHVAAALKIRRPVAPEPNLAFVSESLRCRHRLSQYTEQDCAFVALSVLTGDPTDDFKEYAASLGLEPQRGLYTREIMRMLDGKGIEYRTVFLPPPPGDDKEYRSRPTVREFAAQHPHGAYLVIACGFLIVPMGIVVEAEAGGPVKFLCHAIPVYNGKMYNACGFEDARVISALEIVHPAPAPNVASLSESRCVHGRSVECTRRAHSPYMEQDCSIIALSVITGDKASDIAQYAIPFGWDPGLGMTSAQLLRMLDAKGIKYRVIYTQARTMLELDQRPTVREFAEQHPHGAYLVGACHFIGFPPPQFSCHAMPIYDGKVYNVCGFEHAGVAFALEILDPVAPEPNLSALSESLRCGHLRSQYREQNCSVLALSVITGDEASDLAEYAAAFGLAPDGGITARALLDMLDSKGIEYTIVYDVPATTVEFDARPTVREFAGDHPEGAYLVVGCYVSSQGYRCHAVPVVAGKMYNACGFEDAHIMMALEILDPVAAEPNLAFVDESLGCVHEIIRKKGSQWCLYSRTGRNLGCYDTKAGAKERERQVQYFKHREDLDSDWAEHYLEAKGDPEYWIGRPTGTPHKYPIVITHVPGSGYYASVYSDRLGEGVVYRYGAFSRSSMRDYLYRLWPLVAEHTELHGVEDILDAALSGAGVVVDVDASVLAKVWRRIPAYHKRKMA
jgi:hypothetical protein